MSSVLIGVSGFFRDAAVFDRLRASVLPGLLKRANGLRVCSLGCSEGQELYSITMLIDELGALEKSDLLGVDCRREAIARARAGWVEGAELEKVPLEFRERYFIRSGLGARVVPRVRESTRWQEGNCLQWDYSRADWDVILFRNVAIYLKREEAVVVWQRVAEALKPGGVLVTGKAEQPPKGLPLKRISHCLYIATERAADKSMML